MNVLPEIKMLQDLLDLVLPFLTFQEESFDIPRFLDQTCILCQKDSVFPHCDGQEFIILDLAEKESIESKDLQPLGQFSKHAIDNEFHLDSRQARPYNPRN